MHKHVAHIDSEWRKSARRFYNHLFMCQYCRGTINAYCKVGGMLREEYTKAVENESK